MWRAAVQDAEFFDDLPAWLRGQVARFRIRHVRCIPGLACSLSGTYLTLARQQGPRGNALTTDASWTSDRSMRSRHYTASWMPGPC